LPCLLLELVKQARVSFLLKHNVNIELINVFVSTGLATSKYGYSCAPNLEFEKEIQANTGWNFSHPISLGSFLPVNGLVKLLLIVIIIHFHTTIRLSGGTTKRPSMKIIGLSLYKRETKQDTENRSSK
jgi:hypothetical protein